MPSSKTTTSNKAKKSVSKKQSKQVKKELAPAPKQQTVVEDTAVVKEVSSENSQTKSTFESRMSELTQEVLGLQTTLKSVYKNIGVLQKEYAKEKKVLLELTKKRGTFKNKKKLLMKQHGGFLGTLLGIKYFSSSAAVEKKG